MDLETENRIAAILLKEAAELLQRAEREGVHVYLEQPKVRARPNSRFLAATVLGVQQSQCFIAFSFQIVIFPFNVLVLSDKNVSSPDKWLLALLMHDCTALKLLSGFLEKIFVSWLTFCN
jgi:hypothetical protein